MRYPHFAKRFDRIARHPLLPIGAALVISVATFGIYSRLAGGTDDRATPSAPQDARPVDGTGKETKSGDDDTTASGGQAPAVIRGATSHPDGENRGQSLP